MITALVALPFGLAIGLLLGMVGGGGAILAVPVLVYVLGEPVKSATSESLLIVCASALVGALDHGRAGRVRWRTALEFALAGGVGAIAGATLNRLVDPHAILLGFAGLLVAAAVAMTRRGAASAAPDRAGDRSRRLRALPLGLGTGVLTGFFGVGGGFLIVPALVLVLGLPIDAAVGTSLLVITLTSSVALAAHASTGDLNWLLEAALAATAVVGTLAGRRVAGRLAPVRIAHLFAGLLLVVAGLVVAGSVAALV